MKSCRLRKWLWPRSLLCFVFLAGIVYNFGTKPTMLTEPIEMCSKWKNISGSVESCIRNRVRLIKNGQMWRNLDGIINRCAGNLRDLLHVVFLLNKDDHKGFIDYANKNISQSCSLVTIGIGDDIEAERKFLSIVPYCQLFGADPILSAGQIYNEIGKYFNVGVSGQRGNSTASVLENSIYTDKIIHHIGFVEFIKESIGISFVDFLFLDAEGAEYQIMPLLSAGGPVDSAGISICQIAAEMHGPVINYGINMSQWDEIIRNFLFKSDFLPLWSDTIMGHYRTYFINYRNPICVRKFFSNLCSGES